MNTASRRITLIAGSALLCCGCQTISVYEKRSMEAPSSGFVEEMDEPSSRGMLARISPEQSDVRGRFCLSPDGSTIVFSGVQGAYSPITLNSTFGGKKKVRNLWKIPIKGGAPVKITSGGRDDSDSPSFTANGTHIVYSAGGRLWKVRSDGAGGRMRIPGSGVGSDVMPHVSSKNQLVFCSLQPSSRGATGKEFFIWKCELDGGNLTQMREGIFPTWSPDGEQIVFGYNGDIWMINANGTELTQLTNTADVYEGVPSFSRTGERIAYASNEGKDGKPMYSDFNIWAMRIDGAEKEQITELDSWDSWPIWGEHGIFFLSGRAAADRSSRLQRIWLLRRRDD